MGLKSNLVIRDSDNEDDDIEKHLFDPSDGRLRGKCFGYVCLRYMDLVIPAPTSKMARLLECTREMEEPVTWVGHCEMIRSTVDKDELTYTVHIRLNQNRLPPLHPEVFNDFQVSATIEWIAKSTSER